MKKLADISAFERLQNQACPGAMSDMSVFNRETPKLANIDTFTSVTNGGAFLVQRGPSKPGHNMEGSAYRDMPVPDAALTSKGVGLLAIKRRAKELKEWVIQQYISSSAGEPINSANAARVIKTLLSHELAQDIAACVWGQCASKNLPVDDAKMQDYMKKLVRTAGDEFGNIGQGDFESKVIDETNQELAAYERDWRKAGADDANDTLMNRWRDIRKSGVRRL